MNMTGLNVRKISNKLLLENLSQVRKITFYMQGYFSSYPNNFSHLHYSMESMDESVALEV